MSNREKTDFQPDRPVAFISHHSSQLETARQLKNILERNNIHSWLAPDDIDPGLAFDRAITQQVRNSDLIILLFCSKSDQSRHVKRELMMAEDAGKLICPVRLEDVSADGLAYWLNDYQWIDWFDRRDSAITRLIESIKRQVSSSPSAESGSVTGEAAKPKASKITASEQDESKDFASNKIPLRMSNVASESKANSSLAGGNAKIFVIAAIVVLALLAIGALVGIVLSQESDRAPQMASNSASDNSDPDLPGHNGADRSVTDQVDALRPRPQLFFDDQTGQIENAVATDVTRRLSAYFDQTARNIQVVTIRTTDGRDIREMAIELLEQRNADALILVAGNDERIAIVGEALSPNRAAVAERRMIESFDNEQLEDAFSIGIDSVIAGFGR